MAWNDTAEGVGLNDAFENLRATYNTYLPAFIASLTAQSNRPITG